MNTYLDKAKARFQQSVTHFREDIAALRTGRASAALVENVLIDAYGSRMPINQLASVSVPESKCLLIQPWDKAVIKDIEKGILGAGIGLNPVNEGNALRLMMPPMTEENRRELAKLLRQKLEKAKQSVRSVREDLKNAIADDEKEKKITQDDKFRYQKELDDLTQEINDDLKNISDDKEKEIMSI